MPTDAWAGWYVLLHLVTATYTTVKVTMLLYTVTYLVGALPSIPGR
jgi:hypothetical protein